MSEKILYNNSYIQSISGIDYVVLNEEDYYKTGLAAGHLFLSSNYKIIKLLTNPFFKILLNLLYLIYKKRIKSVKLPRDYEDEIRGYSHATKIPFKHLLLLNLLYEFVGCSSFAFFNQDGSLIVGHNTDESPSRAKFIFQYIKPLLFSVQIKGKKKFVHVGGPFFVGVLNGFNEDGIVITSHYVDGARKKIVKNNISTSSFSRIILEYADSFTAVQTLVKKNLTYIPVNYLLASLKEIKISVLEMYPSDFNFIFSSENKLGLTNHFQSEKMSRYHKKIFKGSTIRKKCLIDMLSRVDNLSIDAGIKVMKDVRNGLERHDTGYSITNAGTFQSFIFSLPSGDIYISNGSSIPVSLSGKFIKISTYKV